MQAQLAALVANFNGLIDTYAEPEFKDKWKVSIQDGSVSFGSAKDKWAINIDLMKEKGISFKDVLEAYSDDGKVEDLVAKAPLVGADDVSQPFPILHLQGEQLSKQNQSCLNQCSELRFVFHIAFPAV